MCPPTDDLDVSYIKYFNRHIEWTGNVTTLTKSSPDWIHRVYCKTDGHVGVRFSINLRFSNWNIAPAPDTFHIMGGRWLGRLGRSWVEVMRRKDFRLKADEDHRFKVKNKCQVILLAELRSEAGRGFLAFRISLSRLQGCELPGRIRLFWMAWFSDCKCRGCSEDWMTYVWYSFGFYFWFCEWNSTSVKKYFEKVFSEFAGKRRQKTCVHTKIMFILNTYYYIPYLLLNIEWNQDTY